MSPILRHLKQNTDSLLLTIINKSGLVQGQGGIADINAITSELQVLQAPADSITIISEAQILIDQGSFPKHIRRTKQSYYYG